MLIGNQIRLSGRIRFDWPARTEKAGNMGTPPEAKMLGNESPMAPHRLILESPVDEPVDNKYHR